MKPGDRVRRKSDGVEGTIQSFWHWKRWLVNWDGEIPTVTDEEDMDLANDLEEGP